MNRGWLKIVKDSSKRLFYPTLEGIIKWACGSQLELIKL